MSQPVKLSDALVLEARQTGGLVERSIAGQVEYWARLGKSVDLLLNGRQISRLQRTGEVKTLSELLESVEEDSGKKRLTTYLAGQPYPHFRPAPGKPGLVEQVEEDGTVSLGRLVGRVFVPELSQPSRRRR